jgi:hypothetical protein
MPHPEAPRLVPGLRGIPARFIGIGVRPEHIHTKEETAA